MAAYELNLELLAQMPKRVGVSLERMAHSVGITRQTLSSMLKTGTMPVAVFVELCNRYHYPATLVLRSDSEPLYVALEEWSPLEFSAKALSQHMLADDVSAAAMARDTGSCRETVSSWRAGKLSLLTLVSLCNSYRWNLPDFMPGLFLKPLYARLTAKIRSQELEQQCEALEMRCLELERRCHELEILAAAQQEEIVRLRTSAYYLNNTKVAEDGK